MSDYLVQQANLRAPEALYDIVSKVSETFGPSSMEAKCFSSCFLDSWNETVFVSDITEKEQPEFFVVTGDIPAMWLRDSTAQVFPYLAASGDESVYEVLSGVLRRQIRCVNIDPYANAFNDGPVSRRGTADDLPEPGPWVWERKYELDSICAPLVLAHALWKISGRVDHLTESLRGALLKIMDLVVLEQCHENSFYTFIRPSGPFSGDSLSNSGRGDTPPFTGMSWSAFRPSDDRCEYPYLIPSNALMATALLSFVDVSRTVWMDEDLARRCEELSNQITAGILEYGIIEHDGVQVLAYEVDGRGNALLCDDANLPSLLSLPLLGWIGAEDPLYQATRKFVLSEQNPYYYSGSESAGVGSPHTPENYVWPLAIASKGLTGDRAEALESLQTLARTTGGTCRMHESFDVDNPYEFTRPWFGWATAMYAELAMKLSGIDLRSQILTNHFDEQTNPKTVKD